MLEWIDVKTSTFVNAADEPTTVKILYDMVTATGSYTIDAAGRDLDLIASDEMGTETEVLNIIQNNKVVLSEYDYDLDRIHTLRIPV